MGFIVVWQKERGRQNIDVRSSSRETRNGLGSLLAQLVSRLSCRSTGRGRPCKYVCGYICKVYLTQTSFLKQHLGSGGPETADVEALKLEVTELKQKVEQLTEENAELKQKLTQYEPAEEQAEN